MTEITIPRLSLVVLIGASGSGKSTFARKHFLPSEVISSDFCRAIVSDDENDQTATKDAFEVLNYIASKRLAGGKLTVIDATNVQPESRKPLVALAKEFHVIPVAIVFMLPEKVCQSRNKERPDRDFGAHVIRQQTTQLRRSIRGLKREGFRHIFTLATEEAVNEAALRRVALWNDRRELTGPFDIIGDLHGCYDELIALLGRLGYAEREPAPGGPADGPDFVHPEGRRAVFLGDLVDRGPKIVECLKLVKAMVAGGGALCVPGNHDMKLVKKLQGRDVQLVHGLAESVRQIEALPEPERGAVSAAVADFLDGLVSHYVLDGGKLVVAHAGLKQAMQGRGSARVRDFCLYGETTGETDEFGLPVRYNWAAEYRGPAMVVYGHTPVPESEWLNKTINIDTGCVFGGRLTALRYPERELVSVDAAHVYCEPARPFPAAETATTTLTLQQSHDDLLEIGDVIGKRQVSTALHSMVTIREEHAMAALEVMSRFAVNPKWLIYLPPTMSPTETSSRPGYLEYPEEAFAYYRSNGVPQVLCEEKHMGSRAIVIVCRDVEVARKRFGVVDEGVGVAYTRTGRRFFKDPAMEAEFLERFRAAITQSGMWEALGTEWVCLDCEMMPWSEKAQDLLRTQYAAVGSSGRASLRQVLTALGLTAARVDLERGFELPKESGAVEFDAEAALQSFHARREMVDRYVEAYRRYCWSVQTVNDLKLAPFHIMATEGEVHARKDHGWHMTHLAKVCAADPAILMPTAYLPVDTTRPESVEEGYRWWDALTERGGEGMVVKPLPFIAKGKRGLVQPAVKCRGREYLRIIYGPEYTEEGKMDRLKARGLGVKRSLAAREFALGIEGLMRFIRQEPLRRVHECVFGVLALESEPVDPRL